MPASHARRARTSAVGPAVAVGGGVLLMLVLVLLRVLVIEAFVIPAGGMIPTLQAGDHVFANKLAYRFQGPRRGDVVVFRREGAYFVSRVVGVAGDEVDFNDTALELNGTPVPRRPQPGPCSYEEVLEGGVRAVHGCRAFVETLDGRDHGLVQDVEEKEHDYKPAVVPPGHFYVVGDNRDNSYDSRFYGSLPSSSLVGRVWRIWYRQRR